MGFRGFDAESLTFGETTHGLDPLLLGEALAELRGDVQLRHLLQDRLHFRVSVQIYRVNYNKHYDEIINC